MKKNTKVAACLCLVALAATTVGWSMNPSIVDIEIPSNVIMEKGETQSIEIDYTTDKENVSEEAILNAANKLDLIWSSSNEAVATVDENGQITAKSNGETNISLTVPDSNLSATCLVEVKVNPTDVTVPERITLSLNGEESSSINAIIQPADATDVMVTYHSSDEAIASVDEKGTVKAISEGACVITTKLVDREDPSKEFDVLGSTIVKVQTAPKSLSLSNVNLFTGNSIQLNVIPDPVDATTGLNFTWTSSDETIASMDKEGKVTAKKVGVATVTATNELGQNSQCTVTVKALPVQSVTATTPTTTVNTSSNNNTSAKEETKKENTDNNSNKTTASANSLKGKATNHKNNVNGDTVGWLRIPNTNINYPVMQSGNNSYYSNHNPNRAATANGSIWADYEINFNKGLATNTILYGHNWTNCYSPLRIGNASGNDVMFAQLPSFSSLSFAKNNPFIYFSTTKEDYVWQVFAAFYTEATWTDYIYAYPGSSKMSNIISQAKSRSLHDYNVNVSNSDKILTLSTCTRVYGNHNNQRFVVMAKLVPAGTASTNITANVDFKRPKC